LRESRIYVVDPAPIPADEMQSTFDWMKSWGFLENVPEASALAGVDAETREHVEL